MKKLYSNIGDKVCAVAKICGIIGIVLMLIGIYVAIDSYNDIELIGGIATIVLGASSLIGSWPMYAFGQITNDVHAMRTSAPAKSVAPQFSDLPEL